MPGSKFISRCQLLILILIVDVLCISEKYALEYDKKKKRERLDIATKQLKTAIVKENMKEYRR